jgi:hypothetical protein
LTNACEFWSVAGAHRRENVGVQINGDTSLGRITATIEELEYVVFIQSSFTDFAIDSQSEAKFDVNGK